MIGVWPAIARAKHLNHTSNHIRIRHFHTHTHKVLSNNNLDLVHCSWGSVLEYVTDQLNSEFVVAVNYPRAKDSWASGFAEERPFKRLVLTPSPPV